mmetsp:Transcript_32431/g.65782  ORF Transcript_32431/g.65782 Transcript_32431/m.65782 type:complete len:85 (+) Transcript_32431:188-442(+)
MSDETSVELQAATNRLKLGAAAEAGEKDECHRANAVAVQLEGGEQGRAECRSRLGGVVDDAAVPCPEAPPASSHSGVEYRKWSN